jgi:hypothetical protein
VSSFIVAFEQTTVATSSRVSEDLGGGGLAMNLGFDIV